ncbi:MAG: hypothetical protein ACXWCY_08840 [Burkholderiales bacterium]
MGDNAVPPMKVGFNYPWAFNDYGQNFGPIFFPVPAGLPRWKKTLPAHLIEFKAMGLSVIRWFILMNGLNYGRGLVVDNGGVIQKIELPIDRSGIANNIWEFNPPDKLHPFFTDHFRLMLEMFRDSRTGLQVIPSFVDFPFFAVPLNRKANAGGGRQDVALDANKRKLFFDTVLEPFLQVSKPFKEQIFAWEVMNEPSWLIRIGAPFGPVTNDSRMNESVLRTFLQEALDRIEAHPEFAAKSTVGHRFIKDLGTLPTGKLRQFHYYAKTTVADDPKIIPDHATTNAFVGEFSPEFSGGLFEHISDGGASWPELNERDRRDTVVKRMKALADKGYTLAMIWPNVSDDGTNRIKLDPLAEGSLERYTGTFFIR